MVKLFDQSPPQIIAKCDVFKTTAPGILTFQNLLPPSLRPQLDPKRYTSALSVRAREILGVLTKTEEISLKGLRNKKDILEEGHH